MREAREFEAGPPGESERHALEDRVRSLIGNILEYKGEGQDRDFIREKIEQALNQRGIAFSDIIVEPDFDRPDGRQFCWASVSGPLVEGGKGEFEWTALSIVGDTNQPGEREY